MVFQIKDNGLDIDDPFFKEVMFKRSRVQVAATMEQYEKVMCINMSDIYMIGNRFMIQYPIIYAMYITVILIREMEYDLSDIEIRFEFV